MAGKRGELVPRPTKRTKYEIRFATTHARKGWQELVAAIRNPLADAWDFLTRTPQAVGPKNYPLRGDLASITRDGKTHERWQHKPTQQGDARIWFYVEGKTVHLEQVHTNHPNETK
ncbi:hypothetical protein [Rhodococcus sp. APC 3903]|uniref:hypothetical protein n=1 Tax=Rhodococcus sp. APC 3903 TaxID=3035193 RepID=UPI0025B5BC30|nr:hypothetical protein [Rhodococcus sp. APC 3903]MDN3459930.1 hypothetical protein [Rhodococcus sp. APC 3903]